MKRLSFLIALTLITGLVILLGCKGEQGDPGPAGSNPPSPPIITAVYAVPDSIGGDEYTTLIVNAYDPNGDSLSFLWTAPSGVLSTPNGPTTHWTPDSAGLFAIVIAVTDQHGTTYGSVNVGVETYVPQVIPSYLGANYNICAVCHEATVTSWHTTPHSMAFDSSSAPVEHTTTGYDLTIDNGGYDDNPGPHLENVQCEACHGPLGPEMGIPHTYLSAGAMTGESCGHCHAEWTEYTYSGHGTAMERAGGHEAFNEEWGGANCRGCHIGEGFVKLWDPDWADREIPHLANQVSCGTCHDPHMWSPDNPEQLRADTTFNLLYGGEDNPGAYAIDNFGKGQTCGQCHHSRSSRTSIMSAVNNGAQRAYPHYSPQADMVAGRGSYEIPGLTYVRENHHDFTTVLTDVCASCHMFPENVPYPHTNHNFHPDTRSCMGCHGNPVNFDINGKQTEIQTLLDQLGQMLPNTQDENGHYIVSGDTRDTTNVWTTREMREAAWAWQFVSHDGSLGIHNYPYAHSLLTNAIDYLTPSLVERKTWQY